MPSRRIPAITVCGWDDMLFSQCNRNENSNCLEVKLRTHTHTHTHAHAVSKEQPRFSVIYLLQVKPSTECGHLTIHIERPGFEGDSSQKRFCYTSKLESVISKLKLSLWNTILKMQLRTYSLRNVAGNTEQCDPTWQAPHLPPAYRQISTD